MASKSSKPTFLLIHGAWHQPEHWHLVTPLLQNAGYEVDHVKLPSVGSHFDKDPGNGLDQDTAAVADKIRKHTQSGKDLVVVAHGYGGMPMSNAATVTTKESADLPSISGKGKILKLVYLAAYALEEGDSIVSIYGTEGRRDRIRGEDSTPEALPPPGISEAGIMTSNHQMKKFYNTCPKDIAEDAISKLQPMALSAFLQPQQHCAYPETDIPIRYYGLDTPLQREFVQKIEEASTKDFRVVWLEGDHAPFLHSPEKVVKILVTTAEHT